MARIISGAQQDTNFALLQGTQIGREWGAARNEREAEKRRQMETGLRMQEIAMKFQEARAEREQLMNRNAQMGDVRALQDMYLRSKLDPQKLLAIDVAQMGQGITDEKAREEFMQVGAVLMKEQARAKEFQHAGQQWQRAQKDVEAGIYTPEQVQGWGTQLQSAYHGGDSAQPILGEMQETRAKFVMAQQVQEENEAYLAQAQAYYDSLPPGYQKERAGFALKSGMAPSVLAEKGSGAKTLKDVQMAGLGTASQYQERQDAAKLKQQEMLGPAAPAPGLGGMTTGERSKQLEKTPTGPVGFGAFGDTFGAGGPNIPPLGADYRAYAQKIKAEKEKRYPGSTTPSKSAPVEVPENLNATIEKALADGASNPSDIRKYLREAGIPQTQEVALAVQQAYQGWRTNAQNRVGGSDREWKR